jgi:hypothetical protein
VLLDELVFELLVVALLDIELSIVEPETIALKLDGKLFE